MSVFDPHDPYINHPPEMERLLEVDKLPPVIESDEPFDHRPLAHWREHCDSYMHGFDNFDPSQIERLRVGYHAAIALIDQQVGRVLETLRELRIDQDTLVVFASDHGDMLGDHGLYVKGGFFYDACTRVPLIVRWPGAVEPGTSEDTPVQLHDLAATILTAAGLCPEHIAEWMPDSKNILDRKAIQERGHAICVFRNSSVPNRLRSRERRFDPPIVGTMWRDKEYKLNLYQQLPPNDPHPAGELYNVATDVNEMHSLWDHSEHRAIRDELITKINMYHQQKQNSCPFSKVPAHYSKAAVCNGAAACAGDEKGVQNSRREGDS